MPEISVRYGEHHCPSHDLAGCRKERLPERPAGIMTVLPDWVCEVFSPGLERKDTITHFLRLQPVGEPHYWIIAPEGRVLIGYALDDGRYRTVFTASGLEETGGRVRVLPLKGDRDRSRPAVRGCRLTSARDWIASIAGARILRRATMIDSASSRAQAPQHKNCRFVARSRLTFRVGRPRRALLIIGASRSMCLERQKKATEMFPEVRMASLLHLPRQHEDFVAGSGACARRPGPSNPS